MKRRISLENLISEVREERQKALNEARKFNEIWNKRQSKQNHAFTSSANWAQLPSPPSAWAESGHD